MIKLKLPLEKAAVIMEAMKYHREILLQLDFKTDESRIRISILEELLYNSVKKLMKPDPPKTVSFKLRIHQATVVKESTLFYQKEFFGTDLKHSILDIIKNQLDQQLVNI